MTMQAQTDMVLNDVGIKGHFADVFSSVRPVVPIDKFREQMRRAREAPSIMKGITLEQNWTRT